MSMTQIVVGNCQPQDIAYVIYNEISDLCSKKKDIKVTCFASYFCTRNVGQLHDNKVLS